LFSVRRENDSATEAGERLDESDQCLRSSKMARLEAVFFVSDEALSIRRLVQLATLADNAEARELIDRLNSAYELANTPFRVERVANGFQLLTQTRYSQWLNKLHHRQAELKLTPPALETLTIVAYRQPVTRADVEAVRGVQCAEMLKHLMGRGLVRIAGEEESLGRPYLYGTTRRFLELFGLCALTELPMAERLRRVAKVVEQAPPEDEPTDELEDDDEDDLDDEEDDGEGEDLEFDDDDDDLEDELWDDAA
jgi:segregation and condensation protein B